MVFFMFNLILQLTKKSAVFLPRLFFVGKCAIASSAHCLFVAWYTSWGGLGSWRDEAIDGERKILVRVSLVERNN